MLWQVGLHERCVNDVYNVGGVDMSIQSIAEKVASKFNVRIDKVPWDKEALMLESGDTVFDSAKLDNLLKYTSYTTVDKWLENNIKYI